MKKYILIITLSCMSETLLAQRFYISNNSAIKFFSKTPFEDITANNKKSVAIIDVEKQEVAVKIPIRDFVFPLKLMQEHFNENYLESDKFPYATFKGFFSKKIDLSQRTNTSLTVTGTMTIHGVSKMTILQGNIAVDPPNKSITFDTDFRVKLEDYNIKVPTVVLLKIAEEISTNAQFILIPNKR